MVDLANDEVNLPQRVMADLAHCKDLSHGVMDDLADDKGHLSGDLSSDKKDLSQGAMGDLARDKADLSQGVVADVANDEGDLSHGAADCDLSGERVDLANDK